jgi:hypothetical protein
MPCSGFERLEGRVMPCSNSPRSFAPAELARHDPALQPLPGIKAIQAQEPRQSASPSLRPQQPPLAACCQQYRIHPDTSQPLLHVTAVPMPPPRVSAQRTPAPAALDLLLPAPPLLPS